MQRLSPGGSRGSPPYFPGTVLQASAPPHALGSRRAPPTPAHHPLCAQQGPLFLLTNADPPPTPPPLPPGPPAPPSTPHVPSHAAPDARPAALGVVGAG